MLHNHELDHPKLRILISIILSQHLQPNKRIVVFVHHHALIHKLHKILSTTFVVHTLSSSTSSQELEDADAEVILTDDDKLLNHATFPFASVQYLIAYECETMIAPNASIIHLIQSKQLLGVQLRMLTEGDSEGVYDINNELMSVSRRARSHVLQASDMLQACESKELRYHVQPFSTVLSLLVSSSFFPYYPTLCDVLQTYNVEFIQREDKEMHNVSMIIDDESVIFVRKMSDMCKEIRASNVAYSSDAEVLNDIAAVAHKFARCFLIIIHSSTSPSSSLSTSSTTSASALRVADAQLLRRIEKLSFNFPIAVRTLFCDGQLHAARVLVDCMHTAHAKYRNNISFTRWASRTWMVGSTSPARVE